MAVTKFTAQLSEKVALAGNYIFFQFELIEPHRIAFQAGQYILLEIPTTPQKKAYSLTSAPRLEHAIQLLIEIVPGGRASTYLLNMQIGDQISFYAPVGEFVIQEEVLGSSEPLVLIATGTGLAPLRSMLLDQLRTRETKRPIKLHWGMRTAGDLFWLDYFEELRKNYPNFTYDITLSQAPEGWTLCKGRVTNCLSVHELLPQAQYYICGNPKMIEDVMAILTERGVEAGHLHHEKFS